MIQTYKPERSKEEKIGSVPSLRWPAYFWFKREKSLIFYLYAQAYSNLYYYRYKNRTYSTGFSYTVTTAGSSRWKGKPAGLPSIGWYIAQTKSFNLCARDHADPATIPVPRIAASAAELYRYLDDGFSLYKAKIYEIKFVFR